MAIVIEMPKLSDTMTEGKILSWLKSEGDAVEPGEVIAEVESDKANMELEAYDAGVIGKLLVGDGVSCAVGQPIAVIKESPDEDLTELLAGLSQAQPTARVEAQPSSATREQNTAAVAAPAAKSSVSATTDIRAEPLAPASHADGRRVLASPLALRMAAEFGLNVREVAGTGPEGRVVKRDIERALAAARARETSQTTVVASTAPPPFQALSHDAVPAQTYEDVQVSSMRRVIAERLSQSATTAPHFYLSMEVDMKRAVEARTHLNQLDGVKISFNDFVLRAAALALTRHPNLNASWQGDVVRHYRSIDIGVAVALPDGLVTPVIRGCHLKGLSQISTEVRELAQKAKERKLTPDDYQGSTFTVSNLGMFGVKSFTAIINPPEACILAVSAIRDVPVVDGDALVPGKRMDCTISCDHRVVDGAQAAHFMRDLKTILENPASLAL